MEKPLVSVIIACYNAEQYIDQCMSALVEQTYSNIEIIVCDDASKDGSLEKLNQWARKDSRIKVLHNDTNLFAAATRNKCFKEAQGDYFCIQDVDDVSMPNRIEVLINEINSEDVNFVSSAAFIFYDDPNVSHGIMKMRNKYPTKNDFLWGISFIHPASIFNRQCIETVGGYRVSPETRRCQDYDLFMRLYAHGYKGKNINEILYRYRLDTDNYKRRTFEARLGEVKIRKKGYRELGIMMPWGWICAYKPILSHFVQLVKNVLNVR